MRNYTVKDDKKVKKKWELEYGQFLTVFNYSSRADREKDKSDYHFSSIVKNNDKEGSRLSKVRKEKLLA